MSNEIFTTFSGRIEFDFNNLWVLNFPGCKERKTDWGKIRNTKDSHGLSKCQPHLHLVHPAFFWRGPGDWVMAVKPLQHQLEEMLLLILPSVQRGKLKGKSPLWRIWKRTEQVSRWVHQYLTPLKMSASWNLVETKIRLNL